MISHPGDGIVTLETVIVVSIPDGGLFLFCTLASPSTQSLSLSFSLPHLSLLSHSRVM